MNDLLKKLNSKNITIDFIDDQLDIKAPKGTMTPELLSEIKAHKQALISFMAEYKFEDIANSVIPKASNKSSYVLSSSQYRLWLLQQVERNSSTYNMPSIFSLKGAINIQDLEKAFLKLIERHEILRTNIIVEKETGIPKQYIASVDTCSFKLKSIDISKDKDVSKALQSIIEKEVGYNFNLEEDTLFRVSLIKKTDDDYILISVMHHIISDGWSSSVMIADLFSLYQSITKGDDTPLEPLSMQYKDFAEWQQSSLNNDAISEDEKYWRNQFKEEAPILDIPTYKRRPSIKTYNGKTIEKRFDKDVFQHFKKLCKDQGATLFMGLLATVKVLLYKYTNQTDSVIGSPFAGREHLEFQNQIGFYVNTVGLRSSFKKEDTFKTCLDQIKRITLETYAHQNYPFDELIKNLDIRIDRSRNPLFDVVLTVDAQEGILDKFGRLQELVIEEIPLNDTTSKFDLEFAFKADKNNLLLTYNTDIYTEAFIVQTTNHLEVVLKNVIENPELTIESVSYLTIKEKITLLKGFNDTKIDYKYTDKTYIDLFEEQVKRTPKNSAIVFEEKRVTYKELDELSNQFSHYLIDNYTINIEDFIGVKLERSDWLIVSFLAILKTGGAYLPIDLEYPKERISFIESDSKCKVIIDDSIISEFENNRNQLKTLPQVKMDNTNLAYVIYTSGSTGTPKGTLIEHKNLLNLCFWHRNQYNVNQYSKGTLYSGVAFDASIWEMSPYLLVGATLYPISDQTTRIDLNKLKLFLNTNNITHSYLPTSICHELVNDNFTSQYITILTGGDTLKIKKSPKFKLYNNYGPTENTVVATSFNLQDGCDFSIPIGKPISNTSCYILDNNLEPLPIGISGKLYVSGAGVARGYLNNETLTTERFIANPLIEGERMYDTGDVAKWLPDGNIEFLGRKDSQVKIRGYRIELEEIEKTIVQFSDNIQQVVLNVKETEKEKELIAYYVSKSEIEKSELRGFLQEKLPPYMVPSYYMALDTVPLTPNGKIDKKSLPKITSESLIQKEYVAPQNEIERQLVEIWQELLGIERIGITDNFYEFGGNSLHVMMIISKIISRFGCGLNYSEFIKNSTIKKLSLIISENQYITHKLIIPKSLKSTQYPATKPQKRIWVTSQMGAKAAYHIPVYFELKGAFNVISFRKALSDIVKRHESLRTVFKPDKINQVVLEIKDFDDAEINFSYNGGILSQEEIYELVSDEVHKEFDFENELLFRIGVISRNNGNHIIYMVFHHLIMDGWSAEVFYLELVNLYNGYQRNKPLKLPILDMQYSDYSNWMNSQYNDIIKNQKKFWKNTYKDPIIEMILPFEKPNKPLYKTFEGKDVIATIDKNTSKKLRQSAQALQTTLFSYLLATFKILLKKYSLIDDIVIGAPFSGRFNSQLENQIGLYINTIPIRSKIRQNDTIETFIKRENAVVMSFLDNQLYQMDDLINELNIKAKPGRSPLFDIMFSYQNQSNLKTFDYKNYMEGLEIINGGEVQPTNAQFDISMTIADGDNGELNIDVIFNTNSFQENHIEQLTLDYLELVKNIGDSHSKNVNHFLSSNKISFLTDMGIMFEEASLLKEENKQIRDEKDNLKGDLKLKKEIAEILFKYINEISYGSNFFSNGASSIIAISATEELNRVLELSLSIVDFYNNPSINQLHDFVLGAGTVLEEGNTVLIYEDIDKNLDNIILIPPIIGVGQIFKQFSSLLKGRFNCIMVDIPLVTDKGDIGSISKIISDNLSPILNKNRTIILGYSSGVNFAFELSKILHADQIELMLVDRGPITDNIVFSELMLKETIKSHKHLIDIAKVFHSEAVIRKRIEQTLHALTIYKVKGQINHPITCFQCENFEDNYMEKWKFNTKEFRGVTYLKGNHFEAFNSDNIIKIINEL